MQTLLSCPEVAELEAFYLGRVGGPDAASVESHVSTCPECARKLASLGRDDHLVRALRSAEAPIPRPQQELMDRMVPLLKMLRPPQVITTRVQVNPASETTATHVQIGASRVIASTDLPVLSLFGPPEQADEIGRLDWFRILEILGAGGMGVVFRAEDSKLKREVALKVIKPDLIAKGGIRDRFLQEAQAIAKLEHDNIVAVHLVNEHLGIPYLVMPLLRGISLEQHLKDAGGPLDADELLRLGREVALGLAAAHEKGLIHRDIKPGNLFLSQPEGRLKILDFGLAQILQERSDGAGREENIVGTPSFMAPEQARGERVDGRADLFSLGCVLYQMATGQRPFHGNDSFALLIAVATKEPPVPIELNPKLPVKLNELICQLMAKKAESRPASAREVVEVISAIEAERSWRKRSWLSRRRSLLVLLAGLGGVAAALISLANPHVEIAPPPAPGSVAFVLDEGDPRIILIQGDTQVTIDPREGKAVSLAPGDYALKPLAEFPDRQLMPDRVTVRSGETLVLKLAVIGEIRKHREHSQSILGVRVAQGKQHPLVISGSLDRTLMLWNPLSDDKPQVINYGNPVRALAVDKDGNQLAAGGGTKLADPDLNVSRWELATRNLIGTPLRKHESLITALAFSPDGTQILSASADGQLFLWNLDNSQAKPLTAHSGLGVTSLAYSPDGARALSAGGDGEIILWDLNRGEALQKKVAHQGAARAVCFISESRFVSSGDDGKVLLWDLKKFEARVLDGRRGNILCLAISPDGKRMLGGSSFGNLHLWDLEAEKHLIELKGPVGGVHGVDFSGTGYQAASVGADRWVRWWQLPY